MTHQRLRPRPVSADRPGALPQAVVRRRRRAGLRVGPGVPATRAWTSATTRSSPCSRPTRRMWTIWSGSTAAGDHPERGDRRQRRGGGDAPRRRGRPLEPVRHIRAAGGRSRPSTTRSPERRWRTRRPGHRTADAAPVLRRREDPHFATGDAGAVVLELHERLVEDRTEAPTFYTDLPTSVSLLTRPHCSKPGVAERWDRSPGVSSGHRLQRAHRSGGTAPARPEQSLLAADGDPGGDGTRRGLPAGHGIRDAADRRSLRRRRRPCRHADHRAQHPRHAPLLLAGAATGVGSRRLTATQGGGRHDVGVTPTTTVVATRCWRIRQSFQPAHISLMAEGAIAGPGSPRPVLVFAVGWRPALAPVLAAGGGAGRSGAGLAAHHNIAETNGPAGDVAPGSWVGAGSS